MLDIKKCPHCGGHVEQTGSTLNLTRGRILFESWICRVCGTRVETRKIGTEPVEVLLTSQPKAVIDAALNDRMEREAEGHREFFAKGGHHVRIQP
ncbi:MAG: hypothetical protein EOM37_14880 [Proteobacteria bacterium]|nr:hypothetical protein [Pseudomonadota bacterium]